MTRDARQAPMTMDAALRRELDRGVFVSGVTEDGTCKVCGRQDQLRADVCFDCKEAVQTDLIDVWEIADPQHRWPYQWLSQPFSLGG